MQENEEKQLTETPVAFSCASSAAVTKVCVFVCVCVCVIVLCLSVSLSVSHTHAHTHTDTYTNRHKHTTPGNSARIISMVATNSSRKDCASASAYIELSAFWLCLEGRGGRGRGSGETEGVCVRIRARARFSACTRNQRSTERACTPCDAACVFSRIPLQRHKILRRKPLP